MYRYRLEYIKDEDKRQVLLVEHEHILAALKGRNIAEAKTAMREHIDNQEITVSRNIKEKEQEKPDSGETVMEEKNFKERYLAGRSL